MVPFARRLVVLIPGLALAGALAPLLAADSPPPSDAEVTKFIAIEKAIAADESRATAVCEEFDSAKDSDTGQSSDPAVIGRRLEASPNVGPLLRRNGMSGQRFTEVSVHVAAAAIGLGMADDLDATARLQGKPATNRASLIAKSPAARVVAARYQELTDSMGKLQALCGGGSGDDQGDEPEV